MDERGAIRERYTTRRGFIIADLIEQVLPLAERFVILNPGARDAFADPHWTPLPPGRLQVYGFEPDPKEVERLNREAEERGLAFRYFAGALWSGANKLTFHHNKAPGGASFFPQNTRLTHRWKFENAKELFLSRDIFYPTGAVEMETTSIDAWSEQTGIREVDFIQMNVEGSELEILKGANSVLPSVLGVMAEVAFVEAYHGRPFFADLDPHLRACGFELFDLIGLMYLGRAASPITATHTPGLIPKWGQLTHAHGIYFRDPIATQAAGAPLKYDRVKLLKLVSLVEIFGQIEYAFELLGWMGEAELFAEAERLYRTYMF